MIACKIYIKQTLSDYIQNSHRNSLLTYVSWDFYVKKYDFLQKMLQNNEISIFFWRLTYVSMSDYID